MTDKVYPIRKFLASLVLLVSKPLKGELFNVLYTAQYGVSTRTILKTKKETDYGKSSWIF